MSHVLLIFRRKKKCEREGEGEGSEESDSEEEACHHTLETPGQPLYTSSIGQHH